MLVTKIDISVDAARGSRRPRRSRSRRRRPSASGSAAAASEPKTTSSTISTIGRPDELGLLEVLLGELLHARPQRALADEVQRHRRVLLVVDARGCSRICGARRRPPGRALAVTSSGITTIGWSPLAARPSDSACGVRACTPSTSLKRLALDALDSATASAAGLRLAVVEDDRRASSDCTPGKSRVSASETQLRARALGLEPAAGEVLGLLAGERAATTTRRPIQTPSTRRRRRATKRSSRSMAACMCVLYTAPGPSGLHF